METISFNRKRVLPVCCTTHVVQDGMTSTIYVLMPILAQAFGFTYAQVGILKGIKNISQAVLEMGSGWLSEKVGESRLIVFGLALSGAGYLSLSAAPSSFFVAVCLLIIGAGTALHHAPSSSLIANNYQTKGRSSALGLYNASGDVGKLAFSGLFSLAIGVGLKWQEISLLFGMITILSAVAIAITTRAVVDHLQQKKDETPNTRDETTPGGWGVLNWRSFASLLIVTGIDTMVQTIVLVFVAFLMIAKGLPLSVATIATVLLLAGGIFGKAGCGFLAEKMGVRNAFTLIQALTALGIIAIVLAPNWIAMALLLPLGAALQGTSSITYGFAANLIDPRRMARGYALLYSTGTFAAAVGPLIFGVFADGIGIETAMIAVAVLTIAAVPPIFILPRTSHPVEVKA